MHPYWIVDYSNPCYAPAGNTCASPKCIAAYGAFAAAAATHFAGHAITFESVNEPNGMGGDNASVITALAAAAHPHFAAAGLEFIGPACLGIDWLYLAAAFGDGLLKVVDAVSVHPYRGTAPETVIADFALLQALMADYGSAGLRVVNGEWGYTSAPYPLCIYDNTAPVVAQGKYVPRMWLSALMAGVSLSIAYDWRNDGNDPISCEDNFGSVFAK